MINSVIQGCCLEVMPLIADASVDMVLCDLPYGMTARNDWDVIIPIEPLWEQYRRIIKKNGAIVLMGCGLFSAKMICAAEDLYKYTLIWKKNKVRGFLNAKKQPLRIHEDILVFYKSQPIYNPQKTIGHTPVHSYTRRVSSSNYGQQHVQSGGGSTERYPTSIIDLPALNENDEHRCHPTQKPVHLGRWLIETYTNDGQLILDNACGSGSFLVAAKMCGRNYIGIEKETNYVECARNRLAINYFE